MLENKGTGIVCFICGKNNHKAKYCPDKKLRGKYRRERFSKLMMNNNSGSCIPMPPESNSISSIEIPKEFCNSNQKKNNKNPFEKAKGIVKSIYDKIMELNYFSNGLCNEIYKNVESIYWLKQFNELNSSNRNIYKNDYASKIIKEKINKIAYNYDKKNGYDNKEYKSFDEANDKIEKFMEEIEKQQMKAKIDLIKEAMKMQVKNELTADLKIKERIEKKGSYSNKKKVYLKENNYGEWVEINQTQFVAEITNRVINSLNKEFMDSVNCKRKELGNELIDNNLNKNKIEKRKALKEEKDRREKAKKERRMLEMAEEENERKEEERKREMFSKKMKKDGELDDINAKFMNYLDSIKLIKKRYGIFGDPQITKSFNTTYKEFRRISDFILKLNNEDELKERLQKTYNAIITMQINNF